MRSGQAPLQLGIDFGGTKIEAALLSPGGEVVVSRRAATPSNYDAAILVVRDLIEMVEREAGSAASIGIGCPGSISPRTGLMRNANSVWLNGRAFSEDLEQALGRPVRLANDANCLALSEAVDGAAAGASVTFAVIVGTGCGGGLVVNGQLVEGANRVGGEWGHIPLPWPTPAELPGPACWGAASKAASKPGCRAPASAAISTTIVDGNSAAKRSSQQPATETMTPALPSIAILIGSAARWLWCAISSILMCSFSAVAFPMSASFTNSCRAGSPRMFFPTGGRPASRRRVGETRPAFAAPLACGPRPMLIDEVKLRAAT